MCVPGVGDCVLLLVSLALGVIRLKLKKIPKTHKTTMLTNNVLACYKFSDIIFIMLINIKIPHL